MSKRITGVPSGDGAIDDVRQREAIAQALREVAFLGGRVFVCRGARVGCDGSPADRADDCNNCYVIEPGSPRSLDEHMSAFRKGDA